MGAPVLHGAGDDRLDVWVDGELVIGRWPPADMHTVTRAVAMEAGVHELRVEYQQHGGDRSLQLARNVARLKLAAVTSWILPVLSAAFFLSRRLLEVGRRVALQPHYGRLYLTAPIAVAAIALPVAIATGSHYDYPLFATHWAATSERPSGYVASMREHGAGRPTSSDFQVIEVQT